MHAAEAHNIIEDLRAGIPPLGAVRQFTVGRQHEIDQLLVTLRTGQPAVTLLQANYGTGKSHLLQLIREMALAEGYVVSTIVVDAKSEVRFNRMDQVLGAAFRGLEYVDTNGRVQRGLPSFFNLLSSWLDRQKAGGLERRFYDDLSTGGTWKYSDVLHSPALYIAIRAWVTRDPDAQLLVEDWLCRSWDYKTQRKRLYLSLVDRFAGRFRDPRPERRFYMDEIFQFARAGHRQSWDMLKDLFDLTKRMGFKGLILLFDEFEDVIQNLKNVQHQEDAFWNLFEFYRGAFPGICFFAVTPEFNHKSSQVFLAKSRSFDFDTLDGLPTFQMSPLGRDDLIELAQRIIRLHSVAYPFRAEINETELLAHVDRLAQFAVADRVRQTIRAVTQYLDEAIE